MMFSGRFNAAALAGITLLAFSALGASPAEARPWNGISPGEHTRADVVKRFGKPYREVKCAGKCAFTLNYQADKAIRGTKQVNFCAGPDGKIKQVAVFPAVPILRADVAEYYGEKFIKKLTDSFVEYFVYEGQGFFVFFNEDRKTVQSLMFTKAKPVLKKGPAPADKKQAKATP
jgi:hypothetical protein